MHGQQNIKKKNAYASLNSAIINAITQTSKA